MINIPVPDDFEIKCDWFKYVPFNKLTAQLLGYALVKNWITVKILSPRLMAKEYYKTNSEEKGKDKKEGLKILGMWDRPSKTIFLSTKNKTRQEMWLVYLHELAHTRKLAMLEFDKIQEHGPDWATIYIAISAKSAGLFWFLGGGMFATYEAPKIGS